MRTCEQLLETQVNLTVSVLRQQDIANWVCTLVNDMPCTHEGIPVWYVPVIYYLHHKRSIPATIIAQSVSARPHSIRFARLSWRRLYEQGLL